MMGTSRGGGPTILHVVGARPNFMKIAPLLRELSDRRFSRNLLVHTGQHYDEGLSSAFFRDLNIPEPDLNLGVGSGSHTAQTAAVMQAIEPVMMDVNPDLLVVVGDVNSTLAAALVGAKLGTPIAHVEAGLRSRDRSMPEELNRILTDQLSDLLLTPSREADANLAAEGVPESRVHFVGNIMIDSLTHHLQHARNLEAWRAHGVSEGEYVLTTLHRPSNVDDRDQLAEIFSALEAIAVERSVLFPIHPRTYERAHRFGLEAVGVTMIAPVGYHEILSLQSGAAVVLTDSGGIQEETTVLGVPCLTLRANTERPITIEQGTNRLVPARTRAAILAAYRDAVSRPRIAHTPEGWDGNAAQRIVDVLEDWWASSLAEAQVPVER